MENNNYQNYQQPQQYYTTPGYQAVNQQYLDQANALLKSAIIACVLAGLPVCSIVAIFKGIGNRKKVLDYLAQGGLHTPRIKIQTRTSIQSSSPKRKSRTVSATAPRATPQSPGRRSLQTVIPTSIATSMPTIRRTSSALTCGKTTA